MDYNSFFKQESYTDIGRQEDFWKIRNNDVCYSSSRYNVKPYTLKETYANERKEQHHCRVSHIRLKIINDTKIPQQPI